MLRDFIMKNNINRNARRNSSANTIPSKKTGLREAMPCGMAEIIRWGRYNNLVQSLNSAKIAHAK